MPRRLVTLGLALLLVACSRPRPSPEYERARALWGELVRAVPAAPADDPRSDEVLRLLEAVPPDSADAVDAGALRARIVRERTEREEERTRREELARRAGPATAMPPEPAGPARPVPAAPQAPQAPALPPLVKGLKLDEFRAAYGTCFGAGGPVQITSDDGRPREGEMWVMKDDEGCRAAHPALVGQTVLFAAGTIAGVSPASAVKRVEVRRDVELAPLPDGSTGMVVGGKVVPLPADARVVPAPGATR